ncbi:MAG: sensor histidine kinase [Gaiellaceae bacterium]
MLLRPRTLVLCVLVCAGQTVALAIVPSLRFAYHDAALHVAVETTAMLVSLVAAFLLFGRVARTRLLNELILAAGLSLLATSNFLFGLLPSVGEFAPRQVTDWGSLAMGAAAAVMIGAASLLPSRPVRLSSLWAPRAALAISGGSVFAIVFAVSALSARLPHAVQALDVVGAGRPKLVGHPLLLATQVALAAVYAIAAYGFYRRSRQTGDELSEWLAIASLLASAARVNYFLEPSLYSTWVYSGDLFRLGFYLALLIGAGREVASYWTSMVEAAQLEERRRLARDLHDGLAQEIAFIARNASQLRQTGGDADLTSRIIASAERAFLESRRVIVALTSRLDEPLDRAVTEAATEVAGRYGSSLDLRVASGLVLPTASREALVRIVSEAVANAANHSGVSTVRVELERFDGATRLRVVDRGRGFDTSRRVGSGFGLISMRERVEALGGRFHVRSEPGHGTQVEVLL